MREVEEVFLKKFQMMPSDWIKVSVALRDIITVIPTYRLPVVPELRVKRNLHILAAAELCNAQYIITGDRDLLELGQYKTIPIIKVADSISII